MKFYETPDSLVAEQDQFEKDIAEFVSGKINPVKFKAIRVAHGVYEQRKEDTYMLRIRCPAGGITPSQLKRVAELAEEFGSGEVHFTTRQEVQIHYLKVEDVMGAIRGLNEVGLSSRGGGGNTVRNILTPADSGIDPEETFDVDPYAMALTTRLIAEPDSWNLPRKYKINFSNSAKDKAYVQATCLGFVATIKDGVKGFKVSVAGGMGANPMVGHWLMDFVEDTKVYHIAKAIKIMFDHHGNRRSRYSSRLKFLWKKSGEETFKKIFSEEYDKIKDDDSLNLVLPDLVNASKETDLAVEAVDTPEFDTWKTRFVRDQKQEGLKAIKIPLNLGDLDFKDAILLTDLLENFGDNTIRCDRDQNILIRNIPSKYLGNAFNLISRMETLSSRAAFVGNMINCTGASTCKLGICLPRGLSDAISDRLSKSNLDLDKLSDFRLNMSGCPNTCGMHHVADLGFFGKVGRKDGNMYPAYNILAGAEVGNGKTEYAKKVTDIKTKAVPDFVHDFLEHYISKQDSYASYKEYLAAEGVEKIKEIKEKYSEVGDIESTLSDYIDYGAEKPLSLEEIGTAECSAGMFDMIGVDQKLIKKLRGEISELTDENAIKDNLYNTLLASSRMLLVTRGLDAKTDKDAFALFAKHFVTTNLVSEEYQDIVTLGKLKVLDELIARKEEIHALADVIEALYKSMDDSLRFTSEKKEDAPEKKEDSTGAKSDKFMDFRTVACPMNFVKTKMALAPMSSGQTLEILLDDGEPIKNVPNSVKLEGNDILEQTQNADGYWSVVIKKA